MVFTRKDFEKRPASLRKISPLASDEQPRVAGHSVGRRSEAHHYRPADSHGAISRLIVKTGEYFAHESKSWVLATGILMVGAIGEIDLLTGPDISLSLFYLLPII